MLIFGNGTQPPDDIEPQPTRSIFGDLFGIGPFLKMLTDPAMMASAQAMMSAITAGGEAAQRLEAKLDLLLKEAGHNVDQINRDFAQNSPSAEIMRNALAALPTGDGSFGNRAIAAPSPLADDGNGEAPASDRPHSRPPGRPRR